MELVEGEDLAERNVGGTLGYGIHPNLHELGRSGLVE